MLKGCRGSVCARLRAGLRNEHGRAPDELHLWATSIRHRGPGMAGAFHAALHPRLAAHDLRRWIAAAGRAARFGGGRGVRTPGGDEDRPTAPLVPSAADRTAEFAAGLAAGISELLADPARAATM